MRWAGCAVLCPDVRNDCVWGSSVLRPLIGIWTVRLAEEVKTYVESEALIDRGLE